MKNSELMEKIQNFCKEIGASPPMVSFAPESQTLYGSGGSVKFVPMGLSEVRMEFKIHVIA
jgi:hypothetical protein